MSDWNDTPTLSGEHVRLEPLTLDHAKGLHEAGEDPGIWTWLSTHQPEDLAATERIIEAALAEPGRQAFAQIDAHTGAVAGTTSYYQVVPRHRILSIGFTWIGKPWHRSPFNTESKLLLLHHAFDVLGPSGSPGRPTSTTNARNAPSNGWARNARASCAHTASARTGLRVTRSCTR